jgi:hypothetical protein
MSHTHYHAQHTCNPPPCALTRRLMHEELKGAGTSGYLASLVGGSVGKALRLLAEKAEYMAAAGPELRQVRGIGYMCPCLALRLVRCWV